MLWAVVRSSRLLIPCELWDRLGERQRSSLLAHELAHLKRRDHWVRLIEVLASVVYWWCPVTWYTRRVLREAEEQLCDAWVVWAIPGSGRDYASALLEAVEFVAGAGVNAARSMPALASGMGQFHQLKRRLVMIKNERVSKKLSLSGWAIVCGLAVLLPLTPTRAQVAPTAADPAASNTTAASFDKVPATTPPPEAGESAVINDLRTRPGSPTGGSIGVSPSTSAPGASGYSTRLEVDKLSAHRDALRAEVYELSRQLEIAQRRLKELDLEAKGYKASTGTRGGPGEPLPPTPAIPAPESKIKFGNKPGAPGSSAEIREYTKAKTASATDPRSRDRRLAEVEANLRALLDEVHALKNEGKGDYTTPSNQNFDKNNGEPPAPKAVGR